MKQWPWLLAIILAAVAGGYFYLRGHRDEQRQALLYREAATRVLANFITEKAAGKKALIVSNPFTLGSGRSSEIYEFERAGIGGLQKGFGGKIPYEIVFPALRPEAEKDPENVYVDPQTTTPLSFLMTQDAFDKLAREHPASKLMVSLVGLPFQLDKVDIWKKGSDIQLCLLLPDWRFIGSHQAIREAFASGKILAAVVNKPDAPSGESAAKNRDFQKAFDEQFLLITSENLDRIANQYPDIF